MTQLYYLSTPYTKFPRGPEVAFREAAALAARLIRSGMNVYAPIVHGHPLSMYGGIEPFDHGVWLAIDAAMMARSDALLVAKMESWEHSYGIAEEIKAFTAAGKPVFYLDMETLEYRSEP